MDKPGFNVKELPGGYLVIGLHLETLNKSSLPYLSESGWVNIEITKNDVPKGEKGYTHRGRFVKSKSFTEKVVESIEKKEEKW